MLLTGFKIKGLTGLYGVHFATIAKLHGTLYHISKLLTLLRQIYFRTAARMKSEPDRLHGAGLCVWNDPFHPAVFFLVNFLEIVVCLVYNLLRFRIRKNSAGVIPRHWMISSRVPTDGEF